MTDDITWPKRSAGTHQGRSLPSKGARERTWHSTALGVVAILLSIVIGCGIGSLILGVTANRLLGGAGYPVVIEPREVTARGGPGEVVRVTFTVRNLTDGPLGVVGARTGSPTACDCVEVEGLPVVLSPKGIALLRLRLRVPAVNSGSKVRYVLRLFLDHPSPPVRLPVNVQVSEASVALRKSAT
ncbi:MAG: hypothetical protein KatS3mg110_2940 [Pirellulaceae bacterium]|nr:MAG: hypothetical protein KatS3mg110_2940 [Pirellulaceae bacterium]